MDGEVDLYRNWTEYKNGFGDQDGEFLLAYEHLSTGILTADFYHELILDIEYFDINRAYAKYRKFKIYPEEDKYKLEVKDTAEVRTQALDTNSIYVTMLNKQ